MGERGEALFRLLVAIVTGVILYFWGYLVIVLIIVHWLFALIMGKRSQSIAEFVEYWNTTSYEFYRYISGVSNQRPFPFAPVKRMSTFRKK